MSQIAALNVSAPRSPSCSTPLYVPNSTFGSDFKLRFRVAVGVAFVPYEIGVLGHKHVCKISISRGTPGFAKGAGAEGADDRKRAVEGFFFPEGCSGDLTGDT